MFPTAFTASQDVDIAVLQRLRGMIDKQRDQIRARDRELSQKNLEIENVNEQTFRIRRLIQ